MCHKIAPKVIGSGRASLRGPSTPPPQTAAESGSQYLPSAPFPATLPLTRGSHSRGRPSTAPAVCTSPNGLPQLHAFGSRAMSNRSGSGRATSPLAAEAISSSSRDLGLVSDSSHRPSPNPVTKQAHGSESEGSEDNDFIPSLTFSQLSFSVDMPDSQGLVTPEAEVTDWLSVQAADEHGRNIPSLASAKGGSLGPHWQRSQRVMSNSVYNLAFGLN